MGLLTIENMIEYFLLIIGLFLLLKSADYLVDGSTALAQKFRVSPLIIGLTIVAFGTSLPELVVNIFSAITGNSQIAFGNILGSNIANTLLILGVMVILATIQITSSTVWKEIPFALLGVTVLLLFSLRQPLENGLGGFLTFTDGAILLLFFAIYIYYVFEMAKKDRVSIKSDIQKSSMSTTRITVSILGGLVGLYFGGNWTVDGAVSIARNFGLSEYLISATIIAIGTSLPELITSVVAALKKNIDIAVGNIIGSNVFNIFWILGLTAVINPLQFSQAVQLDLFFLLFVTVLLFPFILGSKHKLEKWQGFVFLALYVCYIAWVIMRG
jgi:cation:H+ antiporter